MPCSNLVLVRFPADPVTRKTRNYLGLIASDEAGTHTTGLNTGLPASQNYQTLVIANTNAQSNQDNFYKDWTLEADVRSGTVLYAKIEAPNLIRKAIPTTCMVTKRALKH